MKLLVCARHFGYLRNFESALIELARRDHELHLAADRKERTGGLEMVKRLAERFPGVSVGWTPERTNAGQAAFAGRIRLAQDYLRYLDDSYDRAPKLRERARERAPEWIQRAAGAPGRATRRRRAVLAAWLQLVEDALPIPTEYQEFLADRQPDVVMLTPLIDLGSPQLDMLNAARRSGLRSVLAVGSWDHLSSKALIRIQPDMVTVWNRIQEQEAVSMHGLPPAIITVTGAQCYDQWFGRQPSRSREAFCSAMGLPANRPLVLYLCSSPFRNEPPEADFAVEWLTQLRRDADAGLRDAAVLVRPHPGRLREWAGHDLSPLGPVALHGANPIDDRAREDYFDALHHAAAVVGLNTSAFIEAGITGKPVLAILAPEYWTSQEGTLHFRYLMEAGGGLLRTSRSIEEHLTQLAAAIRLPDDPQRNRPFVEAFARPFGMDQPATPRFADAIERLAAAPRPEPLLPRWPARVLGPFIRRGAGPRQTAKKPPADRRGPESSGAASTDAEGEP